MATSIKHTIGNDLDAQGFILDTAGKFKETDIPAAAPNKGLESRRTLFATSLPFVVIGRPYAELFHQDRWLIDGVSMQIKLFRNPDIFCLMAAVPGDNNKIVITEMKLMVAMLTLEEGRNETKS